MHKVLLVSFSILFCTSAGFCQDHRVIPGSSSGPLTSTEREGYGHVAGKQTCKPIGQIGTPDRVFASRPYIAQLVEHLTGEPSAVEACKAIGDAGRCLIAAHASEISKINFDCLRSAMVGTQPRKASNCPASNATPKKMSLESAIAQLQPTANAKAVEKLAARQAGQEVCLP